MMKALLIAITLFALSAQAAENPLVGTWKFTSFVREVVATGERQNEFGDKPDGYISYQSDGRMFAVLVGSNRPKPAGMEKTRLFGTLIAYSGDYVVEGDKITHKIDVSWNQLGRALIRFASIRSRATP